MNSWALAMLLSVLVFAMGTDRIEDVEPIMPQKRAPVKMKTVRAAEACVMTCDEACDRCALADGMDCDANREQCYAKCLKEAA